MIKTHTFNGVKYDIDIGTCEGYCDEPNPKRPSLAILSDKPDSKHFLYLAVHEGMHACNWSKSEADVEQASKDLHNFLWRLGYRKVKDAER